MKNLIIMNQRYIKDFDIDQIIIKLILIMISPNIEYIQYKSMILLYIQLLKIISDRIKLNKKIIKKNNNGARICENGSFR